MKKLRNIYNSHIGKVSDKWSFYLEKYDEIFCNYRNSSISILEIGIQNGGSIDIWSDYFKSANHIIGCDINPECKNLKYDDKRIDIIIGNANDDSTEREILSKCGNLDIVIDDGSHNASDIVRTFQRYFKNINDGGVFIAEDLHCSYWEEFEGGLHAPHSPIAFFKRLADITSFEHWGIPTSRSELLQGFAEHLEIEFDEEPLSHIHSVEFSNSICVIRKAIPKKNTLGQRIIVGDDAQVVPEVVSLAGFEMHAPDQIENPYAQRQSPPEEELYQRLSEITELQKSVDSYDREIRSLKDKITTLTSIEIRLRRVTEAWKIRNATQENKAQAQEREIARLNNLVIKKDSDIAAVLNSTSWKISAPVRFIGRNAWRLKRLNHIFQAQRSREGGSVRVFVKAIHYLKQHGIRSIREKLRLASIQISSNDAYLDRSYFNWILNFDSFNEEKRSSQVSLSRTFEIQPLISILMPVYNAPIDFLRSAIVSVQKQTYFNWELCIADDFSTTPEIRELLESFENADPRIKVVYRAENGHIAHASNSALEIASGEYIALLDQDDILPEYALYFMVEAINSNPDAGILFSDEDKIDESGQRSSAYFKPDFNLYLFRSQNLISHLGVYRRDLVKDLGGFRPGFEGSQDYDLALRCVEKLERRQIVHVPRVLYHWRIHEGSTASSEDQKPYAIHAGVRSLQEHLQRVGCKAEVITQPMGMYRVKYALPPTMPMISLIIPTRNAYQLVKQCIESIISLTSYPNYEILLVDNGSDDAASLEYFAEISKDPRVRLIRDDSPFNYSAINNRAVKVASGEYIGLINNDIEVITTDWLEELLSHAAQPGVGAVGARLWYPDNRLQHGGVIVGLGGVACHAHKLLPKGEYGYFCRAVLTQEFSAVTAACLVIKRSIFEEVNGLNETDLKVAFNDVDFCLRVKDAGYVNVWTPFAELYHHESATRGLEDTPEKTERFRQEIDYMRRRWPNILVDYAYNPNLTLNSEDFSLGWPPRITL